MSTDFHRQDWEAAVDELTALDDQIQKLKPSDSPAKIRALKSQFAAAEKRVARHSALEDIYDARRRTSGGATGVDSYPCTVGDNRSYATARGSLKYEGTYRPDTTTSFFRDIVRAKNDPEAWDRLRTNQREALNVLSAREARDVSTGDPGAGGFVPPLYLGDYWAELPRAGRPFADVVPKYPMPPDGMQITIPKVQSGTSVAVQAVQADAISETDIDSEAVTADLVTIAGLNDVSLQSLERTFPGLDKVIYADLLAAHDTKLDVQLLAGTGSNNQHLGIRNVTGKNAVTYTATTPNAAGSLPKLYEAISAIASTRFLPADTIVMHPRRAAWLASSLSSTFPLFQQGNFTVAAGSQAGGFATSFGGLNVILDSNIGTVYGSSTSEDECYLIRSADLMLFEGAVQFVTFQDVLSANLQVRLRLHSFSFFVPHRQPKAIAVVSGTGLSSPVFG